MQLSFDQLKSMVVFSQVVRYGSLSSAAKHLGISRAVVSYHIKRLEKLLDVKLLNRSTRSMSLTDEGKQYYQSCRRIADEAEEANRHIENMKQEPEGTIKITCSVNLGTRVVVPLLSQFMCIYSRIKVDLTLTDEVVNIIHEGVDIAIRGGPLEDSELKAVRLATMKTYICAAPSYLNKHGVPRAPEDLSEYSWVYYNQLPKHVLLSKKGRQYNVSMSGVITTNNAVARTSFVESGVGLGRIPEYDAAPGIDSGKLEIVLADYELPSIDFYCVFSAGATSSKKVSLLVDYLKEHVRHGN